MPDLPPAPAPLPLRVDPPKPTLAQRLKKTLGPVGVALLFIGKFFAKLYYLILPALKFLPVILKTGGTMLLSIGFYAMSWGWRFALGFVLLIFVHECGHLVVARRFGLKVGAPVFIPFMGAFIALKDAPRNAWMEACVGLGGPVFGAAGSLACEVIYLVTGYELFRALAYSGFFLNLFNLAPIGFLDGGRIATALSPWLWIAGLVIISAMAIMHPNVIVIVILVMSLPRLWMLFRAKTDAEKRYFEVTPARRWTMAALYFGLVVLLVLGMSYTHLAPPPRPMPLVN
ncbi:MAG: site-2 protease family protein [Lacunisphaera sp.]|nr:site-2 protease family protein [Lacunisphaera sp.]